MDNANSTAPAADSIRWGRRAPVFVATPEWVLVADITPQAKTLYALLLAHVNRERADGVAWPGMDVLAKLLGYRRRQSVSRYIRELKQLGAIDVHTVPTATGRRNVYVVNELADLEYKGCRSLTEFHRQRRLEEGMCAPAHHGSDAPAHDGLCAVGGSNQTNSTRGTGPDEFTSSDAYAASGPRASSSTERKIYLPPDFDRIAEDGDVIQVLMGCAIAALQTDGLELHPDARAGMADTLKRFLEDGNSRARAAECVRRWINAAGTDDPGAGWLAA